MSLVRGLSVGGVPGLVSCLFLKAVLIENGHSIRNTGSVLNIETAQVHIN